MLSSDNSPSNLTRDSMLARLRLDDPEEWRRLNLVCVRMVYGLCRRIGIQPTDAEDITQDVLITVSERIGEFRRENPCDSFQGWLFTIIRHRVFDRGRQVAAGRGGVGGSDHRLRLDQIAEELSSITAVPNYGLSPTLLRAIDSVRERIDDQSWRVFWRFVVEGQAATAIAAEMNLTPGAVRTAKHRVAKRLKAELGSLSELLN